MKRIISWFLILVLIAGMLPVSAVAAGGSDVPEWSWDGWTEISDTAGFNAIRNKPDGKYYLTADISGVDYQNVTFTGVLDGNGHTVSYSKYGSTGAVGSTHALFNSNSGTIRNLTVAESVSLTQYTSTVYAAAICITNNGTIANCATTGSIAVTTSSASSTGAYLGGLVYENTWKGTIIGCDSKSDLSYSASNATLSSKAMVITGGIAAVNGGTISFCNGSGITLNHTMVVSGSGKKEFAVGGIAGYNNAAIQNSHAYKNITVTGNNTDTTLYLGGIAGKRNSGSGTITACETSGNYTANYIKKAYVGRIIGDASSTTISRCYTFGRTVVLPVENAEVYMGGITGIGSCTILDSCVYNSTSLTLALNPSNGSFRYTGYVGGISGQANGSVLTRCYFYGPITADGSMSGTAYRGGIAGQDFSSSITSCHYGSVSTGLLPFGNKTDTTLCSGHNESWYTKQINFAGYDFSTVWRMFDGSTETGDEHPIPRNISSCLNHSTTYTNAAAPSCTNAGHIAYSHCANCGQYFHRVDSRTLAISAAEITVPATGHSYPAPEWTWASDYSSATAHFTCSVCGGETELTDTSIAVSGNAYTAEVTLDSKRYSVTEVRGGHAHTDSHVGGAAEFATELTADLLDEKNYQLPAGSYYLTGDLTAAKPIQMPASGTVSICLNGYVLKGTDGSVFEVVKGGNLSLYDCGTGTHKFAVDAATGLWTLSETGTETVTGGVITGGTGTTSNKTRYGGAIYMNEGELKLYNVNLIGNSAAVGSAIYAYADETRTAEIQVVGGRIAGNIGTNAQRGGDGTVNVYGAGTTFTMTGGKIDHNTCGEGGALFVDYNAVASLDGTTLEGNTAADEGGAIHNRSAVYLKDVTITGNSARYGGGAVYNYGNNGSALYLSGKVVISGNTCETGPDLYLNGSATHLYIQSALTAGSKLGVYCNNPLGSKAFTAGWNTYMQEVTLADYVVSGDSNYEIRKNDDGELIFASPLPAPHPHCDCAGTACDSHDSTVLWTPTATLPAAAGHYYLTADVVLTETWQPVADTFLCLNGHSITAAGSADLDLLVQMNNNVDLLVTDCQKTGTISNAGGSAFGAAGWNSQSMSLTLWNITVSNCGDSAIHTGFETTLHNCTVTGNSGQYGGAVRMDMDSTLTATNTLFTDNTATSGGAIYGSGVEISLEDCAFTGNTATSGGALYMSFRGVLTAKDTRFTENTATSGGAVYMTGATAAFEGCTITGNTARWGAGLDMSYSGTVTVKTTKLNANIATSEQGSGIGGAVYMTGGSFTMESGEISGNTAGRGSAIEQKGGTVTLSGGTITDSKGNGAIYVEKGDLYLTGTVSITGNRYYGVYLYGEAVLVGDPPVGAIHISGAPVVTGNNITNDSGVFSAAGNLVLNYPLCLTVDGPLTDGAAISIGMEVPGTFTSGWKTHMGADDGSAWFTSDGGEEILLNTEGELMLMHATHTLTYTAAGSVLTGACICGHTQTATLTVPADAVYDPAKTWTAAVTCSENWQGAAPVLSYTRAGAATTDLTSAGTIEASAAVGGVSVTAAYTIEKAVPDYTVPAGLTAAYGEKLADVALPAGWTWSDADASVGEIGTNTFEAVYDSGNANLETVKADVAVTVVKAVPAVTWPAVDTVCVGDTAQLTGGTASVPGSFTLNPDSWDTAGEKTAVLTFTPDDQTHYETVVLEDVSVTVVQKTIDEVPEVPAVTDADFGTAFEDLGLPTHVEVTLQDGTKATLPVSWESAGYDDRSLETQTITGTLESTDAVDAAGSTVTVQITLQPLTPGAAVFADKTVTYCAAPVTHELAQLPEGAVSAAYTYDGAAEAPVAAGTYTVQASFTMEEGYTALEPVQATLTIGKATIGIQWGETTFVYDGDSHVPAATATGLKSDADVCTLTVEGARTDAGDYTAAVTGLSNDNYRLPEECTTAFFITRAEQDAPAAITGSYAVSAVNPDTFVYTVDAIPGALYRMDGGESQESPVFDGILPESTHTFSAYYPGDLNHFDSPAVSTGPVTFDRLPNPDKPALHYDVSGNSGSRTITITPVDGAEYSFDGGETWTTENVLTGVSAESVTVAIRYAQTAVYEASESVEETVNTVKPQQTVTMDTTDRTAVYGDGTLELRTAEAEGKITYSSSNPQIAAVDPDTGAVTVLAAGTVTITASAAETESYAADSASYKLVIEPAELTIAAVDKTARKGTAAPDFTAPVEGTDYTVAGLIGEDTLLTAPVLSCAVDMDTVGTYEIQISGADAGSNYTITYVSGVLTVEGKQSPSRPPVQPDNPAPEHPEKPEKPEKPEQPEQPDTDLPFIDVDKDDWFYKDVEYVYNEGLMNGMTADTFEPYISTSRAMIVTILWRMEGEPAVEYDLTFLDVPADTWYTEAVRWAASEGIVEGYSAEAFGPADEITREQMATILYRFALCKGYDTAAEADLSGYADADQIGGWAVDAMEWAVAEGLIQGDGTVLMPKDKATRAQAAAILTRFCRNCSAE